MSVRCEVRLRANEKKAIARDKDDTKLLLRVVERYGPEDSTMLRHIGGFQRRNEQERYDAK